MDENCKPVADTIRKFDFEYPEMTGTVKSCPQKNDLEKLQYSSFYNTLVMKL